MARPFGQHFLRDEGVVQRIVDEADLEPGQRVLEIGPGRGVLTARLADAVGGHGRVVAVEADVAMAGPLRGRWANVDVLLRDAVRVDLAALGPFDRIVANLPYQISGPVTARLLDLLEEQGWQRAVLMYQKEFAQRLLAGPGTKKYGRLSVAVARLCEAQKVCDVAPGAFAPPPKVDSTVLVLRPRAEPLFQVRDKTRLDVVVERAFGQRRKKLRNSLAGIVDIACLERLEVADLRPEQVAPEMFGAIADAEGARDG